MMSLCTTLYIVVSQKKYKWGQWGGGGGGKEKKGGKLWKKKMPKNCALFQPIKQFDYDLPK